MKLPVIQNAFENVKKFSQEKLVEKYPNGVPEAIQKRYLQELTFLENSDCIDDFEIFRCLSEEAKKSNTLMNMRGTVSGSILCYLLGNHSFNPLSTHYYCTECGYYEKVDTHLELIFHPENVLVVIQKCGQTDIICLWKPSGE